MTTTIRINQKTKDLLKKIQLDESDKTGLKLSIDDIVFQLCKNKTGGNCNLPVEYTAVEVINKLRAMSDKLEKSLVDSGSECLEE